MFRSYFTAAIRNVRRYKGYAFINIFGLAVGLAACLLIALYVRFELSYDRMHEHADRIVRVESKYGNAEGGQPGWSATYQPIGPLLEENIPQIEETVRIGSHGPLAVQVEDRRFYEDRFLFAEPELFDVFDFAMRSGSSGELVRPGTILLSESAASKYFPGEDPLGKTLTTGDKSAASAMEYEVVGTFADMPANVHFRADFLASFASNEARPGGQEWSRLATTYALLREESNRAELETVLSAMVKREVPTQQAENLELVLRPLTRIHLYSEFDGQLETQGDVRYVWIFSGIALLILLIACINYMNLATARSAHRSREVGVRKVVGASRGQLVSQFLSESVLFAGVALILAAALAQLALPVFNSVMDKDLALEAGDVQVVLGLLVAALIVGLVSGSYPALLLSRMKPAGVLKGSGAVRSGALLRRGLVIFQFVISIGLIIGTAVIQRQLEFVQESRLGFDKEHVMILPTRGGMGGESSAFKQALQNQSAVIDATLAYAVPGNRGAISFFGKDEIEDYEGDWVVFQHNWVDFDFVETLGIQIVEGRAFDESYPSDVGNAFLINETAVETLGWETAVGKVIQRGDVPREVVGVFADFHNESMKKEIAPMILEIGSNTRNAVVRLQTNDMAGALAGIEQVWNTFIPGLPFQYSFLDDEFDAMYRNEQRLAGLFSLFSSVAILIAVLGLFGLAAYTAQQRTKEIGIRKVLGASVSGLVVMLSKEFVHLVLIAFVVAAPLAYFVMEEWLSAFAYRIDLGPGIFVLSGAMALVVALGTVSWQAVRAATSDPVKCLRYE